jgi:hypothetical protein
MYFQSLCQAGRSAMFTDLGQESSFEFGSVVPLLTLWLIFNGSLDLPFQWDSSPGCYQWVLFLSWNRDDRMEKVVADYLAARQDTVDLLHQFTDEQLAILVPTVVGGQTVGGFFAEGITGHAAQHMTWIEEGFRQGV